MDFIGPLKPVKEDGKTYEHVLVVIDRLSKGVQLLPFHDTSVESTAKVLLKYFVPHHGLPDAIVSDRQWAGNLWRRLCQLLGIQRRISTAYHPQTDGATERANAEVKRKLSKVLELAEDGWLEKLPSIQLAINNSPSSSTGVAPFFLMHGYCTDVLQQVNQSEISTSKVLNKYLTSTSKSPIHIAETIATKLRDATAWAQSNLAMAQLDMEKRANSSRNPAPNYRVGDEVWVSLKNMRGDSKFSDRQLKTNIIEVVGPLSYKVELPNNMHNVFHADLIRPAGTDPLPSQVKQDYQPPPILVENGAEEYEIEHLVKRQQKRGVDGFLVKWKGWRRPTWESQDALEDTIALDKFLAFEKGEGTDVRV